jgi:hypothetical protein
MVLSVLWLGVAVGWAAWRVWSRQGAWYGGLIELGLLLIVVIHFSSATWAASYRHPAVLIAWEWFILSVVFSVVRQLAGSHADNRRLLAAMLASGVSLSAYAVYQYTVEMPAMRTYVAENTARERKARAAQGGSVEAFDRGSAARTKRVGENNVYATFAHPNAFAGFLALLIPAGWLAFVTARKLTNWSGHTLCTLGAFLILGLALWLTHSRGAVLSLALVALVSTALELRRHGNETGVPKWWMAGAAVAAIVVAALLVSGTELGSRGLALARESFEKRIDYWTATWKLITDPKHPMHFWLGVGPGNFSRHYPRYMDEAAHEQITDPHNLFMEMWATTGVFGICLLVATLGLVLWRLLGAGSEDDSAECQSNAGFATRWEFYIGGTVGLILGFILSSMPASGGQLSKDEFLINGVVAGGRAIVWFAAFALFETLRWTPRRIRFAAAAGITALLLNLCVSGGISLPSVAQPLWVMAAIGMNTVPCVSTWNARSWIAVVAPLPLLAAVWLYYIVAVYVPVHNGLSSLHAASQNYSVWQVAYDIDWQQSLKDGYDPSQRLAIMNRNKQFLDRLILPRLHAAHSADPANVAPLLDLAIWYGEKWKVIPTIETRAAALGYAKRAEEIDPDGKEAYQVQHRLNRLFATFSQSGTEKLLGFAADALAQVVRRDPTSAPLRYQLADALIQAGNSAEGRVEAERSLKLDAVSSDLTRKLTTEEREQIAKWLQKRG